MYTESMQRHVQRIGYNVNRFRGNLLLLKGGKNPEELKEEFMDIERSLSEIFNDIRVEVPDPGLEGAHSTILRAAGIYRDSLREFMRFYDDGDDDHFVHAGLMINEANELLNEAASMMGV
ncbi:hypothetical protein U2150_04230 [Methanothermobacter wolfeii]|uniref:Uncharacterized protein n=2 Tax=Methanothermobacter TaxID=145260 RepID=A0ABU8TW83_METWO|nr:MULTISPECIES: hypothetical protein [Methanothermobacter]ADL58698.1 conserved hypothetical protein [Methanothermobacter marburgensis str. Marburg]QEF95089.1 hypothetical protein FVF72_07980 [Methanothermobacter sp. KEPCO-1]QHN07480.1 hypothetical protein FZP68_01050 [Methanothermobacter sp. THM-2]WBF09271.1 hypothetical protein ISG34_05435 [Methanothermobacter marburgensis]